MPGAEVRVGMVGGGAVAQRHVRTLGGFPDVRIVAVADVDERRAAELAARCGARPYPAFERMLERESLDAVYLCVPPYVHGPPELLAIAAGLPLFVEKPIAVDLPTAEAVAAALRERPVLTAVGYHWRYLDTVERARVLVRDNPARLVLGYWLDKVPPPAWWVTRARSGGQMIEQATHALDLVRFVAGEVREVYARSARTDRDGFPGADVADVTAATLGLESGAVGAVVCTCLLRGKHRAGVDFFCDGVALELSETELVVSEDGDRRSHEPRTDAKALVDRDFIDAVKGGENRVRAPYEEALATQRLACAVAGSADDGRPRRP